jgi:hypothetical protein
MASQGLSDLLAVAITLSRTAQDEHRNPGPIRRMSRANPLWDAPRIHGELRRNAPSPTWRSFLRNHMTAIAAVDMFVVGDRDV